MQPACVKIDYDSGRVFAATKMQWIFPTSAVLAELGIEHADDWPEDRIEAQDYLSDFNVTPLMVETSGPEALQAAPILRNMRECAE